MAETTSLSGDKSAAVAARRHASGWGIIRLRDWLTSRSDEGIAQRFAGLTFLIRVVNAGLAFLTQILLARWMGSYEFGIYIYVWTWVLLLGTVTNVGLASSPQRFVPQYAERREMALLRGYIAGSRWLGVALSTGFALLGALLVHACESVIPSWLIVPFYLGLACLPFYVLTDVQSGLARAYDWAQLAMAPAYLVRPVLLVVILAVMHFAGNEANATYAMWAAVGSTAIAAFGQFVLLERRFARTVKPGPKIYAPLLWLKVSTPIFLVEGFYLLLSYCDVIVLERFVSPDRVAVYYAATKLVSLVAFIYFAVAAATAHRFTEYHVKERPEELQAFMHTSIRWTFLPSLAMSIVIVAFGRPLLWLFGGDFVEGYPLLAVLVVGLLARASIGPCEKLLNMCGYQSACAWIYAIAFLLNIAMNFALVPWLGLMGAAVATSTALVVETILLFAIAKRRLGIHVFYWGRSKVGVA